MHDRQTDRTSFIVVMVYSTQFLFITEECDSGDQRQSGGLCSRFVVFLFGSNDSHLTQEIQVADRKTFIQEKRLWRIFLNVLAVFLIAIIAFLCGFYH